MNSWMNSWYFVVTVIVLVVIATLVLPKWVYAALFAAYQFGWSIWGYLTHARDIYHIGLELASVLIGVYWLIVFWRNRPRGKGRKAAKLIGAKARAIRAKLIAAMPNGSAIPAPA